jgi:hypothetical protein
MAAVATDFNYFGYFTEIEEHFWRKRGAHLLVSPLDWAIVETWQKAGIPLEAVLAGIDRAFESWQRSKRGAGGRPLKSLAYCVDAVLDAAEQWKEARAGTGPDAAAGRSPSSAEPFTRQQLRAYLASNAEKLAAAGAAGLPAALAGRLRDSATRLGELMLLLDSPGPLDLEDLERHLTVLEEKLAATLTAEAGEEAMLEARRELDRALAPYRRKMTADQLATLERQFLHKRLCEKYNVPRLSLFYLT